MFQVDVLDLHRPLLRPLPDLQVLPATVEAATPDSQNSGQTSGTHIGGGFRPQPEAARLILIVVVSGTFNPWGLYHQHVCGNI